MQIRIADENSMYWNSLKIFRREFCKIFYSANLIVAIISDMGPTLPSELHRILRNIKITIGMKLHSGIRTGERIPQ